MLQFRLVTLEINKCLIAAMHAGISWVSFIMASLSVIRSIAPTIVNRKEIVWKLCKSLLFITELMIYVGVHGKFLTRLVCIYFALFLKWSLDIKRFRNIKCNKRSLHFYRFHGLLECDRAKISEGVHWIDFQTMLCLINMVISSKWNNAIIKPIISSELLFCKAFW